MLVLGFAIPAQAQNFTYRGFAEGRGIVYPQITLQDDDRVSVEGRVRFDPAYKPVRWLTLTGSVEGRFDNLEQVERNLKIDWFDRRLRRPALAVRQATVSIRRQRFVLDAGKQFIRWGKADILNPTDRFAPRDFLEVTADEFLAITAARGQYDAGNQSLDLVWTPFFTPSRIPLLGRRWAPPPPQTIISLPVVEGEVGVPRGSQFGARWNVITHALEFSVSYFDGFNHLPQFTSRLPSAVVPEPFVALERSYAPLRMVGADAAVPFRWFTLKAEMANLDTTSSTADDVVLYVVQLERQTGELSLVGGYAGEVVRVHRATFEFAPDRGLTRTFLGRAGYTLSPTRDFSIEAAVRQDAAGAWIKGSFSQARGAHWRVILGAVLIAGKADDFFGQYRRNSHAVASARYSF